MGGHVARPGGFSNSSAYQPNYCTSPDRRTGASVRLAPEFAAARLVRSPEGTQHRNAGFSLVEVMCAILILGIGLVGLTQGITAALRSSKETEVQTAAAFIAAGQIETLRADGIITDGVTEG